MRTRQSTMFKPLKVFAILLAAIAFVHGQDDSRDDTVSRESRVNFENTDPDDSSSAVSTTDPNEDNNSVSILDGGLLDGILNFLQDGPLGIIFTPLGIILRPIFYIVDLMLSPVYLMLRVILYPVSSFFNLLQLPIHGISGVFGDVSGLVSFILSAVSTALSLLVSNGSGLLSVGLQQVSAQTGLQPAQERRKRAIMDSVISMAWRVLSSPFRFVLGIISTIFSPFYLIYRVITWPYHFLFGEDTSSELSTSALSSVFSPLSDLVTSILVTVSESSQDAFFELIKYGWATFKEYLMPELDRLFVWASSSDFVPNDIKAFTSSLHTGYSLLRTLGLL